jgi:hypothetical protein
MISAENYPVVDFAQRGPLTWGDIIAAGRFNMKINIAETSTDISYNETVSLEIFRAPALYRINPSKLTTNLALGEFLDGIINLSNDWAQFKPQTFYPTEYITCSPFGFDISFSTTDISIATISGGRDLIINGAGLFTLDANIDASNYLPGGFSVNLIKINKSENVLYITKKPTIVRYGDISVTMFELIDICSNNPFSDSTFFI